MMAGLTALLCCRATRPGAAADDISMRRAHFSTITTTPIILSLLLPNSSYQIMSVS